KFGETVTHTKNCSSSTRSQTIYPALGCTMTAKIRLTATEQEIENWKAFFDLLARANVIQLLQVSDNYNDYRGHSQYQRVYLEAELLGNVSSAEGVMPLEGREDA
ncbi:hypothetical protein, partial [Limnoraphis robusta]